MPLLTPRGGGGGGGGWGRGRDRKCRDIRFPMLQQCEEKVLKLLQCHDIAATSTEEGKEMICQCRDIITTLS